MFWNCVILTECCLVHNVKIPVLDLLTRISGTICHCRYQKVAATSKLPEPWKFLDYSSVLWDAMS